jgi:transcriptional regulatory protein LevR
VKKQFVWFGAGAVVVAGALIYALGVYPPASKREGQGAIGQRDVYRDPQAHDAAVTPGSAPVAASTLTAADTKRIEEISNQLAAGFSSKLKLEMIRPFRADLAAQMARVEMDAAMRANLASEMSRNFTDQFAVAMEQQLAAQFRVDLMSRAMVPKSDMSVEMLNRLTTQMASEAAVQFNSEMRVQMANQLASRIQSGLASGVTASNLAANLSSELAPKMASQYSSALAQRMTAQFANAMIQR